MLLPETPASPSYPGMWDFSFLLSFVLISSRGTEVITNICLLTKHCPQEFSFDLSMPSEHSWAERTLLQPGKLGLRAAGGSRFCPRPHTRLQVRTLHRSLEKAFGRGPPG